MQAKIERNYYNCCFKLKFDAGTDLVHQRNYSDISEFCSDVASVLQKNKEYQLNGKKKLFKCSLYRKVHVGASLLKRGPTPRIISDIPTDAVVRTQIKVSHLGDGGELR